MGTSTVHRSPATTRWRIVNRLYGQPDVDHRRLLAEIFNASREFVTLLGQPQVADRMSAAEAALRVGGGLEQARAALASAQRSSAYTSFHVDLADRALHRTVAAGHGPASGSETRSRFVEALVRATLDYLVARDITRWVGTTGVRTTVDAASRRDRLLSEASELMVEAPIRDALVGLEPSATSLERVLRAVWDTGGRAGLSSETGQTYERGQ